MALDCPFSVWIGHPTVPLSAATVAALASLFASTSIHLPLETSPDFNLPYLPTYLYLTSPPPSLTTWSNNIYDTIDDNNTIVDGDNTILLCRRSPKSCCRFEIVCTLFCSCQASSARRLEGDWTPERLLLSADEQHSSAERHSDTRCTYYYSCHCH